MLMRGELWKKESECILYYQNKMLNKQIISITMHCQQSWYFDLYQVYAVIFFIMQLIQVWGLFKGINKQTNK